MILLIRLVRDHEELIWRAPADHDTMPPNTQGPHHDLLLPTHPGQRQSPSRWFDRTIDLTPGPVSPRLTALVD